MQNQAAGRPSPGVRGILVLEPDAERREHLAAAAEDAGFFVATASCLSDIERWPAGDIVITTARHFSPWWRHVGAAHVLILANSASEGIETCSRGASAWIPRLCTAEALIAILNSLAESEAV